MPQHIQNIVIRDYSKKNDINLLLSNTEYCMKDCQLILKQSISELNSLDGIIFYSIFQLPANEKQRSNIYSEVMLKEKILYFAVENLSAKSIHDFTLVEDIWSIKKTLPDCFAPQSLNELGLN